MPGWQDASSCRGPTEASDSGVFALRAQPGTVASTDRLLASQTVVALQSLVEARYALAAPRGVLP